MNHPIIASLPNDSQEFKEFNLQPIDTTKLDASIARMDRLVAELKAEADAEAAAGAARIAAKDAKAQEAINGIRTIFDNFFNDVAVTNPKYTRDAAGNWKCQGCGIWMKPFLLCSNERTGRLECEGCYGVWLDSLFSEVSA